MKKLKSCPFCGSELILIERTYGGTWICCEGCYTETKLYDTEEKAIEAWNTRVTDDKTPLYTPYVDCGFGGE